MRVKQIEFYPQQGIFLYIFLIFCFVVKKEKKDQTGLHKMKT